MLCCSAIPEGIGHVFHGVVRSIGDIVQEKYDEDEHFVVWNVPELLATDMKEFLGSDGLAYGVLAD